MSVVVPPAVVTATSFEPREPDVGIVKATEVSVVEPKIAATPPIINPEALVRPVPKSTDEPPPAKGPDMMVRDEAVGTGR